jgi:ribonuclease G
VIILPGESLAKYRSRPHETETAAPTVSADASTEPLPQENVDPEEQQAIEEEAEELELAEKILSHHDNETPEEVEDKIDEVKQDQPLPESTDATSEQQQAAEPMGASAIPFPAGPEPFAPFHTHASEPGPFLVEEGEISELVEDAGEDASPAVPEALAEDTEEYDIFEADEPADAPVQTTVMEAQPQNTIGESSQAQTATVRDQGNRYMHRVSRRMRRRRGGSRFAPGQETGTVASSGGAGAAVAFEPENRREQVEERSAERPDRALPSITELLKPGQEIIVQIAKEPLGQKGARITSHIALPGR